MRRREFIGALIGLAGGWPPLASAQASDGLRRIAMLTAYSEADGAVQSGFAILLQALRRLGWQQGRTVQIDIRWGDADPQKLRRDAKELIGLAPDVIVTETTAATRAVAKETQTIPNVFVRVTNPIGGGFVSSLVSSGNNRTGLSDAEPLIAGKWLEIIKAICPGVVHVFALFNPRTHSGQYWGALDDAARPLALEVRKAPVEKEEDFDPIIAAVAAEPNAALIVMPDPFTITHRTLLVPLMARYHLPALYSYRFFAEAGGLVAYSVALAPLYEAAAGYVDHVLKGERPTDLPIQHPAKYELVVNLQTARALGLAIPPLYLARADDVIE